VKFQTESDETKRTFKIKPTERHLVQFDAHFRRRGMYEVSYVLVTVDLADDSIDAVAYGRKVAMSDSTNYLSGVGVIYNTPLEVDANAYVRRVLNAEKEAATKPGDLLSKLRAEGAEEQARYPRTGERVNVATPGDTDRRTCVHCGEGIKSVMGGQGSTWVHIDGYRPCKRSA
jgi:hypothetical protein